ncbi:autotransporter assembly complex family protein [Halomonas sp. YLGW01]|uniref:autotransporter assembly complex protein TamA n=1 Tax=Halomonas sp. YLGW01 TaxID=2773308 RepID=UPI00177AF3DE|nr:autotransporter assembly complex family protein [Halomonas sp. YLGW01]
MRLPRTWQRAWHRPWRWSLAGLCLSAATAAQALDVEIEGLEGPAADNVVLYLEGIEPSQYREERLRAQVRNQALEAMRVFGYYDPSVAIRFTGDPIEEATLAITPGPRVTITVLDLSITGDAQQDEAFDDVLADPGLEVGDPLEHAPYDSLRGKLSSLALQRGYFDADFPTRRMEVRPWEQSARIYLHLASGPRYRFGDIDIQGSQIDEDRLRMMLPFESGDPYLAGQLALYNQRLSQSNWFSSISVHPRLDNASDLALEPPSGRALAPWWQEVELDGESAARQAEREEADRIAQQALLAASRLYPDQRHEVPVDVTLVPADRHQFEVGIGYATDVGPRTRFSWTQPWMNSAGHSLSNELFLSAPEQEFSGEYLIPLENPLRDSYAINYGFQQVDNEDTNSLEISAEVSRRWKFDNGWTQDLFVRTTYEDYTQADEEDQVLLYYPGISWSRTRSRNPIFPTWGDRQRLALAYSDTVWGSDATFLRATLDTQWLRMIGNDNRFIARTGLGAIQTNDFDKIPPSLRFFAGGDRSVRGYSYESLSPENDDGELVGGRHLLTAGLEAQRRITGDWWGAAFVDTGNAFNAWSALEVKTGAGLGIRWVSPVGPIRFDVAHPYDDEDNDYRIHFSIGPEF